MSINEALVLALAALAIGVALGWFIGAERNHFDDDNDRGMW